MGTREISTAGFLTPGAEKTVDLDCQRELSSLTWFAIAAAAAIVALLAQIGADSRWLAAVGQHIVTARTIPDGLPYAAAPSAGWENAPVLGELVFHALYVALSDRGLVLLQVVAVAAAFVFLGRDMRAAGAGDSSRGLVLIGTVLAAAPAFLVVRAQVFTMALFPLLVLLLRSEARVPSRRIWLIVPLVALWSNLHGGVLVGVVVSAAYLVLDRARRQPWTALAVLLAAGAALFMTPGLAHTPQYYAGVFHSEPAARGFGLWASLSLRNPLDLVFVALAVRLVWFAVRSRPRIWELASI